MLARDLEGEVYVHGAYSIAVGGALYILYHAPAKFGSQRQGKDQECEDYAQMSWTRGMRHDGYW